MMVWLLIGWAWAAEPARSLPDPRPAVELLQGPPVVSEGSVAAARAKLERAAAAAERARPRRRARVSLALGDAHAELAVALQLEAYAAADAAWAAGAEVVLTPDSTHWEGALRAWDEALAAEPGPLRPALLERRAWALGAIERDADAAAVWRQIVADHPATPEARRAELALAEALFAAGSLREASALYERVATGPVDRDGTFAAYKLAWCRYALGRPAEAIEGWVGIAGDPGADALIREEAARDAVVIAAELPVADALAVLARLCGADAACECERQERLADGYEAAGRATEAAAVRAIGCAPAR